MTKQEFTIKASASGVTAAFSGKKATMFIQGVDEKVKRFIRLCNLKGKAAYPFTIAQG